MQRHLNSMKWLLIFLALALIMLSVYFITKNNPAKKPKASNKSNKIVTVNTETNEELFLSHLKKKATAAKAFAKEKGYSSKYCFLINMNLPSGKNRFFIYDLEKSRVFASGLVAHGNCRSGFLEQPVFSNVPECGCSAEGRYKIGYPYQGQFGKAFKLHGLDTTNSNAFKRNIVLHAYDCVPDEESYPQAICNSLGCPMVSYRFLNTLTTIIENSGKPILLWIYN